MELTPAGDAVYRRLKSRRAEDRDARDCEGLSADDQADLRRILERIRTNVGGDVQTNVQRDAALR